VLAVNGAGAGCHGDPVGSHPRPTWVVPVHDRAGDDWRNGSAVNIKKENQVYVCNRCEWAGDAVVEFCPTCGQDGSFTYLRRYEKPYVPRTLRCAECSELLAPSELEVCSECQLEGLR